MRLLRNVNVDWKHEILVQISETSLGRALRTKRWKYGVTTKGKDGWKHPASDTYHDYLYDLEADPYELTNLNGYVSHQALAESLREKLIE